MNNLLSLILTKKFIVAALTIAIATIVCVTTFIIVREYRTSTSKPLTAEAEKPLTAEEEMKRLMGGATGGEAEAARRARGSAITLGISPMAKQIMEAKPEPYFEEYFMPKKKPTKEE